MLSDTLASQYNANKLTKNNMNTYLEDMEQFINIATSALTRAADLMKSFKQVAVDQASEQKRIFLIIEYIEEILLCLYNKIKQTDIEIELACDENLSVESYPGIYSQIITNLVMNSLIYAFDKGKKGHIKISFSVKDGVIRLIFSDDGKGIPDEILDKIFTPFFYKGKNSGGSGLGLSIVHNLVTEKLHGTIRCESKPGKSTRFTILIPA